MRNVLSSSTKISSSKTLALLVTLTLAGCAAGPDYRTPDTPVPTQFGTATLTSNDPALFTRGETLAAFWTEFNDVTLNQLVQEALSANHDLRIALANLNTARALRREARFDLAPTIKASGGYTHQRYAQALQPETGRDARYYDAGVDASWELDFFGRARRQLEARKAEAQRGEAALYDAQVLVTAEVTRSYFELRGAQQQLDVALRNVQNQRETLQLVQSQLDNGRGTELDTSRARAQLNSTQAGISTLQAAVARSIHHLSVLTGREPQALQATLQPVAALPGLPLMVPVSDPAELLRRRPDIRISERDLAAATARIGVAVADLFPRVTFTGNLGYAALQVDGLSDAGSGTFLIAPRISWAAFDLGRVRAQIAAAHSRSDAALARYEQTVLQALEETENALVTHTRARERVQHLDAAVADSHQAAELARVRYTSGYIDFLQVLDAERTQLAAENALAEAHTTAATSLVAVYKSLGGGWSSNWVSDARTAAR